MAKKGNSKRASFLSTIPQVSLNATENDLAQRCKFNFPYFVNSDEVGQDFGDWTKEELVKLLEKLKEYSKFPLSHWKTKKVAKYPVLVNYGSAFPSNTDFTEPSHIPIEVEWCRIHLENKPRLIGFVVPDSYHDEIQDSNTFRFDKNTFYVVFLDNEHKFYKTNR